ncbi:geranylgeranyl pyrophosphate synthase [Kineosporia sp. NBRC 101677]|uniref:polyprenyl synthetase family protein n=1 Tax=Kineosporia sp. NBRC 101677 TaxID=3032197 RepID=UPI0024A46674|nr:polyprenyl synthetase family protein [Kineosporia sp. NBRC 101677]GLY18601.1 geranylgeranyl pyrophosphate synthase [Kineosporia sp. NBRC 101677]
MTSLAPAPGRHPLQAEDLRERVDMALREFLALRSAALADIAPECVQVLDRITSMTSAGKRLRPAFLYWGWRGAGGENCPAAVNAAASLELFQAAALIHDDLIDASDLRRGMPAVHKQFESLHTEQGWQGDPAAFGLAGAVLTGDLCLVWTEELFTASGLSAEQLGRARPMFDQMRTELLGGQYLDVLSQVAPQSDPQAMVERALRVVRFKSAKYSVEHPLLIGASAAGADERLLAVYSEFGLALGEAFQLRDDVLGVFGDPGTTGKPAGDDLREGKRTVLVGRTLQHATAAQTATVNRLLGDPGLDETGVETLREIIVGTGALAGIEEMIARSSARAEEALAGAELADGPARDVLTGLVVAATTRVR